jgi:hypothetical protein
MIWNIENCRSWICWLASVPFADNVRDNAPQSWTMSGWETAARDLTWTFDDHKPRYRHEEWKQVFDGQLKNNPAEPLFSIPLVEGSVPFEIQLSKEDVWKRYRTISHIAVLEGEKLEATRKAFFKALDDAQTDEHGRVAVHGHTVFASTTKIPSEPPRSGS